MSRNAEYQLFLQLAGLETSNVQRRTPNIQFRARSHASFTNWALSVRPFRSQPRLLAGVSLVLA